MDDIYTHEQIAKEYQNDPTVQIIVDHMMQMMTDNRVTPAELRAIGTSAAVQWESRNARPMRFGS